MSEILKCTGLTKKYGSLVALNNLDLSINKGQIIGLLGPNGSGKTTLIKLIAGLLKQNSGELTVNGEKIGINTKKMVSYLPERTYIPDWMRVIDIIKMFENFYEDFNLEKVKTMIDNLGIKFNQRIKAMSKGTKEKLQLILVMSREAQLYLLDEPIAGVDPAARDYILRTIITNYNPEAAVIISTHLIQDIETVLDDVIMIQNGNLKIHKTVDEIREESGKSVDELFREVFRC